jgi:uncharacterized protein (UPF0332 family)
MAKDLRQDIPNLIARAERSLEAANLLIKNGYFADAVSRSYYAMFYAATALLHSEGITVSKHFAKTGKLEVRLHRALIDVFDERQTADYGGIVFSHEDTALAYQAAGEFVQATQEYLDELG